MSPPGRRGPASPREVEIGADDERQDDPRRHEVDGRPAGPGFLLVFGRDRAVGQAADLLVGRRLREIADDDHHQDADEEDDQAPILEEDVVDDPQERALGVGEAVAELDRRVDGQPEKPQPEAGAERGQAALGVQPLHEDAEEEDDEDGRGQVGLHALEVVVEPSTAADDRDPEQADEDHDARGHATDPDEALLGHLRPQPLVEVHGEERGRRVEGPGERAHERRQKPGHDQAPHPDRQDLGDQHREGLLGVGPDELRAAAEELLVQRPVQAALGQGVGDHAGDNEEEDRQELEEAGGDAAAAGLPLGRRAENALDDILVRAPVPEADDGRAEEHADPRVIVVEVPGHPAGFLDRRPGPLDAVGHEGFPQVEHVRAGDAPQLAPAAEGLQAEVGHQGRADDEDEGLDGLGVGDRLEAAEDRVEAGDEDDQDGADPEAVEAEPVQVGQQDAEDDPAGVDADGHLGQNVGDEGDERQGRPGRRREAALQELGHGEDLGAHVERHEHPGQHEQAPGVELVVGHGHTVGRAGPGQADEVLGADVRGEDRGADDEPAEVAPGQEVIGRGPLLLQHDLPGHAEDDGEIDEDDDPVDRMQDAHDRSFAAGGAAWAILHQEALAGEEPNQEL